MQASYERHLFQSGWLAEQGETWASLAASRKCLKMKAGRYARGIFINMYSILYQQLLDTYWNLYTPEENNLGSLLKKKIPAMFLRTTAECRAEEKTSTRGTLR